ncbi:MAG: cytochrome ubiquinol oxidase subunit I [Candidatus Sumerlaeaceae bacterium]|nr:cytochrome ubiquinol oxidase subunit I [Candidatus Sumerlaeaceae bacterium]
MSFDAVTLSRLQFALTVAFHYIFVPLTIGLALIMVILEGLYLKTGLKVYENMARFWTRLFAATFAMGVASGIVMEFQFGTNWATYSRFVGDVFGSALAAEGIFAFFLESGFLAVLVFGWDRVSPRMHFFSTLMVCLGSIFSALWIIIANSWQQTPAGHQIVEFMGEKRAEIVDFWAVVFNPSSVNRITHTLLGAFILGAFFVMSVCGYYILKGRHLDGAKRSFTVALVIATIASLLQLASGHSSARQVAFTQPAKLAAFEGLFKTPEGGAPLYLFGHPDTATEEVKFGIAIPGMLSFLVHGNFTKPIDGLDKFKPEDRPPVALSFHAYHAMVAIGMFFIGLTLFASFLRWRGVLFEQRWLLWIFVFSILLAYAANHLGWVAAEVGRQPWVVYGLLRTSDSVSKSVSAAEVAASIAMFVIIYSLLFLVWLYVMGDKIRHGPAEDSEALGAPNHGLQPAVAVEIKNPPSQQEA